MFPEFISLELRLMAGSSEDAKKALVNVPVMLFVYVRPEMVKQVFNVIKEVRPAKLFLVSDGARCNVPTDKERLSMSREVVDDIDWDCDVHKLYFDTNQGLYITFKAACDYAFQFVDRFVFLEDDVITTVSFFKYCEELLEKYKDDLRINMICGMNHLGVYEEPGTDYFFTRGAASIWGFAIWKRTYDGFYENAFSKDKYTMSRIMLNARGYKDFCKDMTGYASNEKYNGHIPGPEFYLGLSSFAQNQLSIIPKRNMVCNIGFGEGSTNFKNIRLMPKVMTKLFTMKTHDLEFPLKHPVYVVEDKLYEKKVQKVLGRTNPVLQKLKSIFLQIIYTKKQDLLKLLYFRIVS